jgi:hypothetical protein
MCDFETSIWDTLDFGSAESAEADELRSALSADEAEISEIRARQVERLRRADRLQLDTADGFRIMADWVVANLDVSPQTARRMMRIARAQHPLRDSVHRQGTGHCLRRRRTTDRCIRPRRGDPARRPPFRPTA